MLRRFSPRLDFHNIAKLAVLDEADVAEAQDGFDWCSRHMHTESLAAPRAVLTPDEIENRLQQLLDSVKGVKAKQSAVQRP